MKSGGPPDARIGWLVKRADYLSMQQPDAKRWSTPFFVLQLRPLKDVSDVSWRVGFTTSRKVGNAAIRNRARRRLREIARAILPVTGRPGWDYVLVGRPDTTISRDFAQMRADLVRALGQVHESPKARS